MNHNIKRPVTGYLISSLLVVAAIAGLANANPQMPQATLGELTPEQIEEREAAIADSLAKADSIAHAKSLEFAEKAADAYKNLKFIQYDGITEAELYPKVMEVYKLVTTAMNDSLATEENITRFKGMLVDVNGQLMKGSLYYSSAGDSQKMTDFATAYVSMRMDPKLADANFGSTGKDMYPALVYCAATGAYNTSDFARAADFLEEYLNTDAMDRREQVCVFFGQACLNAGQPERAVDKLVTATNLYPANYNLLMITLQNCLNAGYTDRMQPLLEKALSVRPNDEQLLNLQARLYENESDFSSALDLFQRLYELKPNSLAVNQHLALCYYNLAADYYNKALMESDDKQSKKYMRQSNAYFNTASDRLAVVVENDPTNVKYLRALAITYGCLGNKERLEEINTRLTALGSTPMAMNGMPEAITFNDQTTAKNDASSAAVPDFQVFAQKFVENKLSEWTKRREFEKTEEYEKRVSQDNVYAEYQRLCKEAETDYLKRYAGRLRISDLQLQPYDVDNESYLIESAMGPIVVNVPLKNKEAEAFKSSWNSIQLRNPKYYIKDNRVAIASVELVTSAGKTYTFNASNASQYDFTDVKVDVNSFLAQGASQRGRNTKSASSQRPSASKVVRAKSDVDRDIPVTSRKNDRMVALIMANENYKNVSEVSSALNDGEAFAKYCTQTLGIPESQVMLRENLTYAEMLSAMSKLRQLVGALGDGVDVIVYYAGHGFPDEGSKDAFLLPVDGDGFTTASSYPLKKFYSDLSSLQADNVMVFLDACFSGSARDGGMLAEARGIALKPKMAAPEGNMFVLSAASDQETAMPYREKNHGLFTYYLLKKIQETKGNVSLKELSQYVEETVKKNSLTVNSKLQTPRTTVSGALQQTWGSKKLRP